MAKLSINDLHYIVMEGGGARGNTYLGAIKALEKQLKKRQKENPTSVFKVDTSKKTLSIMDYEEVIEEKRTSVIRGVSGASAGAITTFALTLGLNSEEIETVLDFDFTNFLSEKDVAKYRMIGEDSDLMIGEDSGLKFEEDPYQAIDKSGIKTIGGKKSKPFKYQLEKDKTAVIGNFFKAQKQAAIVNFVLSTFVTGLTYKLGNVLPFIKKMMGKDKKTGWLYNLLERALKFLGKYASGAALFLKKSFFSFLWKFLLFKAVSFKAPMKVDATIIGSVIWDRGMFSGFQVREFFYDLMLLAATRDTLFQRRLIEMYSDKPISTGEFTLTKDKLSYPDFKLGARSDTEFEPEAKGLFEHLQNLTFREFYLITGVDYAASVSNFTANTTLYYSHKWTPQFRVLEAVGASMTIPPAIRPVYNASDVVFDVSDSPSEILFPRSKYVQSISVKINGSKKQFVDSKGQFMQTDYALYAQVVKKALQIHILEDSISGSYLDLNNDIELSTFLPALRLIVVGDYKDEDAKRPQKVKLKNKTVELDGDTYEINDKLLAFYYNAQFKGLLLDGGYRNNIPYNYFRDKKGKLKGVLAIKLDRNFPPEFLAEINEKIGNFLKDESYILDKLDEEISNNLMLYRDNNLLKKANSIADKKIDAKYEKLILYVKNEFIRFFEKKVCQDEVERTNLNIERKIIVKLLEKWVKFYGKQNFIKPWAVSKGILATAMEGYSFGSERGQIKAITDHNHIIALYDFGVGTYDFDLEKVLSLALVSQKAAEDGVNCYFLKEAG